jgi:hypothetical protein
LKLTRQRGEDFTVGMLVVSERDAPDKAGLSMWKRC